MTTGEARLDRLLRRTQGELQWDAMRFLCASMEQVAPRVYSQEAVAAAALIV